MSNNPEIFDAKGFANALFERRAQGNYRAPALPLRAAAQEIGVSAATLSRIEREMMPDLPTYVRVCRWLGVPLERFLKTS